MADEGVGLEVEDQEAPEIGMGGEVLPPFKPVGKVDPPGTAQPPAQAQPAAPADPSQDPEYLKHRRGNEQPQDTYRRLWEERRDFSARLNHDSRADRERISYLEQMVTPLLQFQYQQMQEAEMERQRFEASLIPDYETDKAGYAAYVAEQTYNLTAGQLQQQEADRQAQAEYQQAVAVYDQTVTPVVDELKPIIDAGNGQNPDPAAVETAQDLAALLDLGVEMTRANFPGATDAQVHEYMKNSLLLDGKAWREAGLSVQEGIRRQAAMVRKVFGAPNGNGTRQQHVAQATNGNRSRNAAQLQQENQRGQRARPMAPVAAGTPSGQPGQQPDWAQLSEEDYVKAALMGQFDPQKYTAQRFAKREEMFNE